MYLCISGIDLMNIQQEEATSNMCYVDETIPIPDNMPKQLLELLDEIMEARERDDMANFDCLVQYLEANVKSWHLVGRISKKDALQLMDRFGI